MIEAPGRAARRDLQPTWTRRPAGVWLSRVQHPATPSALGALQALGPRVTLRIPGREPLALGGAPSLAVVELASQAPLRALERRDHAALAEAFVRGDVRVQGDLREVLRITDLLDLGASRWARLRLWLGLRRGLVRRLRRRSISLHYDRSPAFFEPWLGPTMSYTHGLYAAPDEPLDTAQERKLDRALASLALEPGAEILDVGCGWGSFLLYAGRQGYRVHGLTLSQVQHGYVAERIAGEALPCTAELRDFFTFVPKRRYAGAVLMGSLEHLIDFTATARALVACTRPGARLYADFCSNPRDQQVGAFLARHIWPGAAKYVDPQRLMRAFEDAGLRVLALEDDTDSYALTVRDWCNALDARSDDLSREYGEESVRCFQLFLRGSQHFFETRQTQAHRLVAERPAA